MAPRTARRSASIWNGFVKTSTTPASRSWASVSGVP
jgi:hypothetical protein